MWAHAVPIGYRPPFVVINEVGSNHGLNSFIEIYAQDGFNDEILQRLHLGIVVLQPDVSNNKLRIIAAVDLAVLRDSPRDSQFFVIGNPEQQWISDEPNYYGSTLTAFPSKRVYGKLDQWLQVLETSMKMVILTCSSTSTVTSQVSANPTASTTMSPSPPAPQQPTQLPTPSTNLADGIPQTEVRVRKGSPIKYPALEEGSNLYQYLRDNQMDIVILRGMRANSDRNILVDGLFHPRYLTFGRLIPYFPINAQSSGPENKSVSRCKKVITTFHHLSFKGVDFSPGRSNMENCQQQGIEITSEINHQIDTLSGDTCIEGTCDIEDHSTYDRLTSDQFIGSVTSAGLDDDLCTELAEICGVDEYRQNFAAVSNEATAFASKRRKLWHIYEDKVCPNDPFLPYKRERKRHVAKAVILARQFQADKINSNDFIANADWIQYLFNPESKESSTYNCLYCSTYSAEFRIKESARSKLSAKEGVMNDNPDKNHRDITHHAKLPTHIKVMQLYQEKALAEAKSEMYADILRNEPTFFKVTNNHMRLVFTLCKTKTSLNTYKEFADTERRNRVEMGTGCKGKDTAKHMAQAISDVYLKETKDMILTSNSPVSLLMDGGDDGYGGHYASVLFQFLDKDKIVQVRFYRLIPLGVMSTGLAYYEAIEDALKKDGLKDYLATHLTSIATDNALNMVGGTKGFATYLKSGLNRPEAISHGCVAHKLQLVLNSALHAEEICTNCNKLNHYLKDIYSFFHRSSKRLNTLARYCHQMRRRCFRARRVMDIRWVASHYTAAKVVFLNWDLLVGCLESFATDPNFVPGDETITRARLLLRFLTQRNAMSTLALQLDLMHAFKGMSEFAQYSGISIAGAESKKEGLLNEIEAVLTDDGTFMKRLLLDAKCEGMPCLTLENYERVGIEYKVYNLVTYYEKYLVPSVTPDTDQNGKVIEKFVDFVKISEEKEAYIEFLREKIEEKMPSTDALAKTGFLDQTKWNFDVKSTASNSEFQRSLQVWPTIFKYEYSAQEISDDFLKIGQFLEDNPTFWLANHFSRTTDFFSLLLRTMTTMPPKFKHILEMTLVIPVSTADPERYILFSAHVVTLLLGNFLHQLSLTDPFPK